MLVRAQAAAAHLLSRFWSSLHLHTRCVDEVFPVIHLELERSGVWIGAYKCATAWNVGECTGLAFACFQNHPRFDIPPPCKVLQQYVGIAALGKNQTSIRPLLLRWFEITIDAPSIDTSGAADEHCRSLPVLASNGRRLSEGKPGALRNKRHRKRLEAPTGGRSACWCARRQQPLTFRSASAPVSIFTPGASMKPSPLDSLHGKEEHFASAQPPGTRAKHKSSPWHDAGLICHIPPKCSIKMLASPRLVRIKRPSGPFFCDGSKKPLILEACLPVAPLMYTGTARGLS